MLVGIIADDMTGLTAVASEFERYGFSVGIALSSDQVDSISDRYDIIGVDTNSREKNAQNAAKAAEEAAEVLSKSKPVWLFKQGDSALHGNIASELSAVSLKLKAKNVLMAPACPSLNRLTIDGVHRIIADDPHTHVSVVDLWSNDQKVAVVDSTKPAPDALNCPLITVVDAECDASLDAAVRRADAFAERLIAGSVGLAKALARHLWVKMTGDCAPALIILGSFQSRSRNQADKLLATKTAKQINLPISINGASDLLLTVEKVKEALSEGLHVILTADSSLYEVSDSVRYPFLDGAVQEKIENVLRLTTRAIFDQVRHTICGLIVVGGKTAGIVSRDILNINIIHNIVHLSDGVAAGLSEDSEGQLMPIVTKAGNWGEKEIFFLAVRWLQKSETIKQVNKERF